MNKNRLFLYIIPLLFSLVLSASDNSKKSDERFWKLGIGHMPSNNGVDILWEYSYYKYKSDGKYIGAKFSSGDMSKSHEYLFAFSYLNFSSPSRKGFYYIIDTGIGFRATNFGSIYDDVSSIFGFSPDLLTIFEGDDDYDDFAIWGNGEDPYRGKFKLGLDFSFGYSFTNFMIAVKFMNRQVIEGLDIAEFMESYSEQFENFEDSAYLTLSYMF